MIINPLLEKLQKEQIDRVFSSPRCELDCEFLGFVETYEMLSKIIPRHFTIVDLGCYAAAQAFYFQQHKKYIGIDVYDGERFEFANVIHKITTIQEYINSDNGLDLNTTFAIVNYVPDEDAKEKAREYFKNIFCFYPANVRPEFVQRRNQIDISN